MTKYIEVRFRADELEVLRAILNDSGMSLSHMAAQGHRSLEDRVADWTGIGKEEVGRLAFDAWRMIDRKIEEHDL